MRTRALALAAGAAVLPLLAVAGPAVLAAPPVPAPVPSLPVRHVCGDGGVTKTAAADEVVQTCTFTAEGTQLAYAVAVPTAWKITVDNQPDAASSASGSAPMGSITTAPGDTVTVTLLSSCDPTGAACAGAGILTALDIAAS